MTETERRTISRRLWDWGGALDGCERRRHEINRLMRQAGDAASIRARVMTGTPHGCGIGDPTAHAAQMQTDALARVDELTGEINAIMARKAQMDAAVQTLPENLQRLVYMRYGQGWTLSTKIPRMLYVDRRTVTRWHSEALERLSHNVPFFGVDY